MSIHVLPRTMSTARNLFSRWLLEGSNGNATQASGVLNRQRVARILVSAIVIRISAEDMGHSRSGEVEKAKELEGF